MYNVISFEDTKHDNHCQRCPMYGMCLGLGNQNRTTFITHSGKMSLRWLTTFLNLGSDLSAVLFLSLYLKSRKTPRWKSIVQKDLYFSFRKELFFSVGQLCFSWPPHLSILFICYAWFAETMLAFITIFILGDTECSLEVLIITISVLRNTPFFKQHFILIPCIKINELN